MSNPTIETIEVNYDFLGVSFKFDAPATAADWDAINGAGDCVSRAQREHGYRGLATPVRAAQIKALEEYLKSEGHDFPFIKKMVNGKEVVEGDGEFLKRVYANKLITPEKFAEISHAAVDGKVTYISTMGPSSRKELGEAWVKAAEEVQGKWARGEVQHNADGTTEPASPERTLRLIRQWLPNATLEDPTDTTALAMLLRDREKAAKLAPVV